MNDVDETDFSPHKSDTQGRVMMSGPPEGIRRGDAQGFEIVDAMAGRASAFGFGFDPITEAIQAAAETYLGDASAFVDPSNEPNDGEDGLLKSEFQELIGDSVAADSIYLCASADMAVETAIGLARTRRPGKAFRTVALVGSDHGRTAACRTASGRPELHENYGPMMAGFAHVPVGDLDALRAVVDEQTASVLISPIDLRNAARPCDADYLVGLRELCDRQEILLMIDETQLAMGSSGRPFAFSAIADIRADVVVLAGGLFAGLPGGIVLASQHAGGHSSANATRYPLQAAVVSETVSSMAKQGLPASAIDAMENFAVRLAEKLSGFEFVRDVNVLGMTIGVEVDTESIDIVRAAQRIGLRIESAGDTGIRIQPPLVVSEKDQELLLDRLGQTMEAVERETANLSI